MKKHSANILTALVAITAFTAAPSLRADEEHHQHHQTAEVPAKPKVKPYTLDTCLVSDEKLGEMGKPFAFNYKDQEIKLCCKACRRKFDKDPALYLRKLEPRK